MNKIKSILLVDDDRATNFYHSIIIRDMGVCDEVIQLKNGKEALDYIMDCEVNGKDLPEYVFIDRHMPVMDGFEFINEMDKSDIPSKSGISVVLLSTLLSEPDNELVKGYLKRESVLKACHKKPLTEEIISKIPALS